jgi:hypothetical protein
MSTLSSRKRRARRVGLWYAGGIRCRQAGAGIYTAAAPRSGLHLERLLCRRERRYVDRTQSTFRKPGFANNLIPAGTPITDEFNVSGFIGGFQGGCNWQWGAWVFGIEGDGSATNKSVRAPSSRSCRSSRAARIGFRRLRSAGS